MGFSEDDRIRSKNRAYNEAFDVIDGMIAMGFSYQDIEANVQSAMRFADSDQFRIDVYNTVLRIVRSLNEKPAKN